MTNYSKHLVVIDESQPDIFAAKCNGYINNGYEVSSSSCGFVQSEAYDFCGSYQAILIKKKEME